MLLPTTYQELERVYLRLTEARASSIAVTSVQPHEGVSLLVDAIARRAAYAGKRVLIVDLNLFHPRPLPVPDSQARWCKGEPPQPINTAVEGVDLVPVPDDKKSQILVREVGHLEGLMEQWCGDYDQLLLDTSPISRNNHGNIPATRVLQAASASVLTLAAGVTTLPQLRAAMAELEAADVRLLGTVLNDRYNPCLRDELLREVARISSMFPRISAWLSGKISASQLLSIQV